MAVPPVPSRLFMHHSATNFNHLMSGLRVISGKSTVKILPEVYRVKTELEKHTME